MSNNYYVYVYFDQTIAGEWKYRDLVFHYQPFYVGKGTRKRDTAHLCPHLLKIKSHKSSKIKSIISKTGELPIHKRIYDCLSNADATRIEKELIQCFGRIDNGTGILCNHTDGGDGANNFTEEIKRIMGYSKRKVVYQYRLDGDFVRCWDSITEARESLNISTCNISSAARRGGTVGGFVWFYTFQGQKIPSTSRWRIPCKYSNIKQIDIKTGKVIAVFNNALEIEKKLNLIAGGRNQIYTAIKKQSISNGYHWQL